MDGAMVPLSLVRCGQAENLGHQECSQLARGSGPRLRATSYKIASRCLPAQGMTGGEPLATGLRCSIPLPPCSGPGSSKDTVLPGKRSFLPTAPGVSKLVVLIIPNAVTF